MDITTAKAAQLLLEKISKTKREINFVESIPIYKFSVCRDGGQSMVNLPVSVAEDIKSTILDSYNKIVKNMEEEIEKL